MVDVSIVSQPPITTDAGTPLHIYKPITDIGITRNATFASIAAAAVAVVATIASTKIAFDIAAIGNRQQKLAQRRWDRFAGNYLPCEQKVMAILCSRAEYVEQYELLKSIFTAYAKLNTVKVELNFRKYGLCPPPVSRRLFIRATEITVDVGNLAYRTEEARKDLLDDIRWNERSAMLNLGRDLNAMAASTTQMGASTLDLVQGTANNFAQGAAELSGYLSESFERADAQTGNRTAQEVFTVIPNNGNLTPLDGTMSNDINYTQKNAITAAT